MGWAVGNKAWAVQLGIGLDCAVRDYVWSVRLGSMCGWEVCVACAVGN